VNYLQPLNALPWPVRLPVKWLVFVLAVVGVCYPDPRLLQTQWQRLKNPDALVNPTASALQPWIAEVEAELSPDLSPQDALKRIEAFVYKKVPYEWDWNNWGVADYFPTVEEVVERQKEDCDGRAIVAASIMRHFGYDAQLVTDFAHLWVKTSAGEVMNPGKSRAAVATAEGFRLYPGALRKLVQPLAYGIAVFPLAREAIVVLVLWWLLLGRGMGMARSFFCLLLLVNGLFLLRLGSDWKQPVTIVQGLAVANLLIGLATPWVRNKTSMARSPAVS
jgi:hypothetical protein